MSESPGVTIRPIEDPDWSAVAAIIDEVARGGQTYAMEVPGSLAEAQEFWSGQQVVVALAGDEILGTAKMGPNRPAQGSHVGTASFMVSSAARGRGVGRALGEYVVAWHRDRGFQAIQFNAVVETNTSAVRLWRSLGFEIIGTVPNAFRLPGGEYVGLHVMHLEL